MWKRVRSSLKHKRPKNYEAKKEVLKSLKLLNKSEEIDLFYGDATGFHLKPSIPYAWQKIKQTIGFPISRHKQLNVFGIWNTKQNLHLFQMEKNLDSQLIINYIDEFVKKIKKKTVFVLDNSPLHKSNLFKKSMENWSKQKLEIFFLPTYSPHLNPIEILWRCMKYNWIEWKIYDKWKN